MSMKCIRSVDELSGKLDKAFSNPKKEKKKPKRKLGTLILLFNQNLNK